jgi:H+/gluconate symporter-like permease
VKRTMLSVVLAYAVVIYGGVSVFVAFFILVPMAREMFRAANIPVRLMPAAIGLGAFTFTMSAMPGTPSTNNAIPMPYFGTTTFAAPGLGIIASITFAFGMWWLARIEAKARATGEVYTDDDTAIVISEKLREQATLSGDFVPNELTHGERSGGGVSFPFAVLPLIVVNA